MRKLLHLAIPVLVCACATPATVRYEELAQRTSWIARTPLEVVQMATPIQIAPGQSVDSKIELSDPALQMNESLSNYELFSFIAYEDFEYRIDLLSLCSCVGFRKHLLKPVAYLLDVYGNVVNSAPFTIGYKPATMRLPGRIHGIWLGHAEAGKKYYFLVAADNREPGAEAASSTLFVPGTTVLPVSVSLRTSPEGAIRVALSVNET